jgi:hypothetical protein
MVSPPRRLDIPCFEHPKFLHWSIRKSPTEWLKYEDIKGETESTRQKAQEQAINKPDLKEIN